MYSPFKNKHLLTTQDWSVEEIEKLMQVAFRLKQETPDGCFP